MDRFTLNYDDLFAAAFSNRAGLTTAIGRLIRDQRVQSNRRMSSLSVVPSVQYCCWSSGISVSRYNCRLIVYDI